MNSPLSYFRSVSVPKDLLDTFQQLESLLQNEHGVDGRHPLATSSEDGFMSARDKAKLDKLLSTTTLTSKDSTTVIISGGGGGGGGGGGSVPFTYVKSGIIFNALNSGTELDLDKTFPGVFDPQGDYAITFRCVDPTITPNPNINLTLIKSANKIIFKPDYDGAKIEWSIMEVKS
jgi:hypothetical protein